MCAFAKDTCNNAEEKLREHNCQQLLKVYVTMCVCTIINRLVYCVTHVRECGVVHKQQIVAYINLSVHTLACIALCNACKSVHKCIRVCEPA